MFWVYLDNEVVMGLISVSRVSIDSCGVPFRFFTGTIHVWDKVEPCEDMLNLKILVVQGEFDCAAGP